MRIFDFTTKHRRTTAALSVVMAVFLFAGCTTTPPRPQVVLTGDPIVDNQAQREAAPPKDKAMWEYRLGAAALRRENPDTAKAALDSGLSIAAANYGNINAAAAKSRGMFTQESKKPFVGEAYERALANYYRGILYWADGEPDNARALFRNAELIDSDTVDKTYAGDYVLCDYLDGLVSAKLSGNPDSGADALKRARTSAAAQKRQTLPDYDVSSNVMVFVEYSSGPTKYAGGSDGHQLLYNVPTPSAVSARLKVDGRSVALPPYDDLGFQAITRGGRVMDQILGNKSAFKQGASAVGDIGLMSAAVVASNSRSKDSDNTALALLAVGLTAKLLSAATATTADTRCWDNIPRYLSFAALNLTPGPHEAELTFFDANGRPYSSQTQRFTITVPDPAAQPIGARPRDVVIFRSQLRN